MMMGPAPKIMIVFRSVRLATRCTAVSHAVNGFSSALGFSGAATACTRSACLTRRPPSELGVLACRQAAKRRDVVDVSKGLEPSDRAPSDAMIAQASADDIVAALVTGPARILAATKPLNAARSGSARATSDRPIASERPGNRICSLLYLSGRLIGAGTMVLNIIGLGLADERDITVK